MTDTQLSIAQAMTAIMKEVGAIAKKDKNTSQGFNFRGIDSVVNAVSPALQKYGVVVVPTVEAVYTVCVVAVEHTLIPAK